MDPEVLSSLCSSLALEEEEETITPDPGAGLQAQGEYSIDRSLVGCVLSTGPIARDAFVHRIKGVWKTKERFEVEAIGSNKFVFHFLSTTDKRRVLSGGPWRHRNKLLVLEEPTGLGDYSKMSFSKAPFWFQLHNIPVFCMSKTVGAILGNMVGTVQEVECNQDGLCLGTFIRVRAVIDISKPLKRILKVRMGANNELVTILLRYEHLPELCFHCGILGHPLKECPEKGVLQGDNLKMKYGAWIKAPPTSFGENLTQSKRRHPSSGPSLQAPLNGIPHPQPALPPKSHNGHKPPRLARLSNALPSTSRHPATSPMRHPSSKWVNKNQHPNPSVSQASEPPPLPTPSGTGPKASHLPPANSNFSKSQMERLRIKLGFSGMLLWEKEGRSGGLCLLWSDIINVQLLSGSKGHIDVRVSSDDSNCWRFTGLYGSPDTSLRNQFWNLMKRLGDSSTLPWLCGGDLNEILFNHEKQGGIERAHYLMSNFREALNYCGLADLGYRGPKFTWCRGKATNLVQERLDRMLGNSEWMDLFPNSCVHHLNLRGSDHRPLLVELLKADEFSNFGKSWKRGRFHFEEAWVEETECSNIIKEQWSSSRTDSLDGEERYWRQRSKDMWLKCGDSNSKFFHQKASARKSKNTITGLLDSNGEWCDSEHGMVLDTIDRKVTPQLNEQLDQVFGPDDVKEAVFQMAPTKSPGADGMSTIFYQSFWSVVGEEVTEACLGFTNRGLPLGNINETIITLLPKIKNPTRITEFRPISLCNVLYKIISKMLANRLRKVMDYIISEEQSAFIPGRLISDNAIIGFECLHAIKRRKTKKNYLALKLDMEKAYDRVEWDFIRKVMEKLGFSVGWTKKIMACISSVSYSFQFNGQKFGHLTPSRGLRQGDPFSPYLFLLCSEGLSSLLHHYEQARKLQGLKCGLRGPTISHLLFADDSLLFIEAKTNACSALKEVLNLYEAASGQAVNLLKSAVCFGPKLPKDEVASMVALLGIPRVRCHEKYLGLPCFTGKNKHGIFSSIKDRVWNKLCGWKSKLLSAGGWEILSKAVIQAIQSYAMNLFKIPISLISELHRLCAQFGGGGGGGGGVIQRKRGCIGVRGRICVSIKQMEVWGSEI
ncbi:hypothetical protein UlMin_017690 [Ulmus minor]